MFDLCYGHNEDGSYLVFTATRPHIYLALTPLEYVYSEKRKRVNYHYDLDNYDLDKIILGHSRIRQRIYDFSKRYHNCFVIQKQNGSECRFLANRVIIDSCEVHKFLHGILKLHNEALYNFPDWDLAHVYILTKHKEKFLNFLLNKPSRGTKAGTRMYPSDNPLFEECIKRIRAGEDAGAVKREIICRMSGQSNESKRKRLNRFLSKN